MLKTYLFLVGAIVCEVCGTMLLPVTQNFTKIIPTVFLGVFYLSAFYLLTFVVDKIPINNLAKVPEFPKSRTLFFRIVREPKPFPKII